MLEAWCHDGIEVQNLTLQHLQKVTKDAWGRTKEQPLLVTVRLSLREEFNSAASTDRLDSSTINYGTLSKTIRGLNPSSTWESLDDLTTRLYHSVSALTTSHTLDASLIRVSLPKASLLGASVLFTQHRRHLLGLPRPRLRRDLTIHGIAVSALVGINPHERRASQRLILSAELLDVPSRTGDDAAEIEALLVEFTRDTCFETLEALILHLARGLETGYMRASAPDATLRLRIEKPLAVPWAHAPALEIVRSPAERAAEVARASQSQAKTFWLAIYRPYMMG